MSRHKSVLNKLTKKELVHFIERGSPEHALDSFIVMRRKQIAQKGKEGTEACWECRFIAKKLGMEE